jgi:hypothetical protein
VVTKLDMEVGECVAACSFKNVLDDFEWAFTGVYGPNGDLDRRRLWDELAGLMSWWDLPWCLGGILMSLGSQVRVPEGGASVQR